MSSATGLTLLGYFSGPVVKYHDQKQLWSMGFIFVYICSITHDFWGIIVHLCSMDMGYLCSNAFLKKKKTYILKLAYKLAGLHNVFIHPQCWLASPLPPPLPCPLTSFPTLSFHVTGSTILLPLKLLGFHFSKGLSSFRAYIDAPNHTHKSPRWKLGSTRERMCGIFCS